MAAMLVNLTMTFTRTQSLAAKGPGVPRIELKPESLALCSLDAEEVVLDFGSSSNHTSRFRFRAECRLLEVDIDPAGCVVPLRSFVDADWLLTKDSWEHCG